MNISHEAQTIRMYRFTFEMTAEELEEILDDPGSLLEQLRAARNGKSKPASKKEPCPVCGQICASTGLTLHMIRMHDIDPRTDSVPDAE